MSVDAPTILVRAGKDGTPFFEAKWRDTNGAQLKRRLGPAWLEQGQEGGWTQRRGHTPPGWLDERTVHVAAAAMRGLSQDTLAQRAGMDPAGQIRRIESARRDPGVRVVTRLARALDIPAAALLGESC